MSLKCFVCYGLKIEKFCKCITFLSVYGWSRKMLIGTMYLLFYVVKSAGM